MFLLPLQSSFIQPKNDLFSHLEKALKHAKETIQELDIVVISSKIVSISENRIYPLEEFLPSNEAKKWAKKTNQDPRFCEAIRKESEKILGACPGALLTLKKGMLVPNAGIDQSNTPYGTVIFWPKNPSASAKKLRGEIQKKWNIKKLGVIMNDSNCVPLRKGTIGFSLAHAGFEGVTDERGKKDLYGNTIKMTQRNIGDALAAAANLLMGDTKEKIPFVIIRGAKVTFGDRLQKSLSMSKNTCLFRDLFR